jgi:hypothetical protein
MILDELVLYNVERSLKSRHGQPAVCAEPVVLTGGLKSGNDHPDLYI